jgi:putative ABC transport system substrate-binding protein
MSISGLHPRICLHDYGPSISQRGRTVSTSRRGFLLTLAAAGLVRASQGQQQRLPLLAILSPASRNAQVLGFVNRPFKEALAKLGYEPGHTIEIVERFADNDETRLPALAAELVALQPRVLFTNTSAAATAMAGATRTIPIVVGPAGESVLMELAGGSLARPTTNVTGFVLTSAAIDTKGIGLLIEAVPAARRIGLLVNPRNLGMTAYPAPQNTALSGSGVTFVRLEATGVSDLDAALAKASAQRIHALFVPDDSHLAANPAVRGRVLRFASGARIPIASSHLTYARDGALLAMGPSIPVIAARAAGYVAKILEGARPEDLPIELPSTFTTIVNLKTAKALGLTIPQSLRTRADEVIE